MLCVSSLQSKIPILNVEGTSRICLWIMPSTMQNTIVDYAKFLLCHVQYCIMECFHGDCVNYHRNDCLQSAINPLAICGKGSLRCKHLFTHTPYRYYHILFIS